MSHASPPAEPVSFRPAKGFALSWGLLALAIAAGATVVAGMFLGDRSATDPRHLVFSYLTSLMFVTSVSVGALAWLMLLHLTGAVWSIVIRRLLENLTRLLPWIAILFIPVALNLNRLYPWADPSQVAADAGLRARRSGSTRFFSMCGQPFISSRGWWSRGCWRGAPSDRTEAAIRPKVVACGRPARGAWSYWG